MNNSFPLHTESIIAGVDIGGSHITVGLIDTNKKEILSGTLHRSKIDSSAEADTILDQWSDTILASYRLLNLKPYRLGIAIPGPFEYTKGISLMREQNKFNALFGMNIKNLLAKKLNVHTDNIIFNNDAACYMQGEVFSGAAKDSNAALGLTLGSGFGSAYYENDLATDADLWHHPFRKGIVEDYLSSRWILKRYSEISGNKIDDVKTLADRVAASANNQAKLVFDEFGGNLAEFLNLILSGRKFDVVVLGGNISKAFSLFSRNLMANLKPENQDITIVPSSLGENAALIGAASFCHTICFSNRV